MIHLSSISFSLLLAIILAYHGFGHWALVVREFSRAVCVFVGTWLACPWRPGRFGRAPIAHLVSFAKNVTGFNLMYFLSHSLDKILLGKLHGPYWLGLYTNAFQFLALPVSQLQQPLMTVGLPTLSALQTDATAFRASFEKMIQLLTFFSMPIILFLAVFGDTIVVLLLGNKWLNAVPIFRIFAIGAFVEPLVHSTGLAMVACGRTKEYFKMGAFNAITLLCSVAIGSFWGTLGITAGYSISIYFALAASLAYGLQHTPVCVLPLLRRLAPNVFCSLLAVLFFLYVRYAMGWDMAAAWLAVYALAIGTAYLGLYLVVPGGRRIMRDYWNFAKDAIPKFKR